MENKHDEEIEELIDEIEKKDSEERDDKEVSEKEHGEHTLEEPNPEDEKKHHEEE